MVEQNASRRSERVRMKAEDMCLLWVAAEFPELLKDKEEYRRWSRVFIANASTQGRKRVAKVLRAMKMLVGGRSLPKDLKKEGRVAKRLLKLAEENRYRAKNQKTA
ncbi:MAG: hypothetical protein A3B99_03120 [Candidatus Yanofskybacteria bacterium RIFCSPHIGHO2_02_FULL_44_12b]|nr:MAG: hypothetical protein A2659_02895 [Candidatus Yanofskybacteria bacterium RIFCSPHIGHO2_01_FULL_44_24]OGN15063.1 MAG: hypothetical protein A3B99_03120 [Candidatus Yanofskybacteria bacterium RIFCSPHIGHO2_02_FULL_44_12b]